MGNGHCNRHNHDHHHGGECCKQKGQHQHPCKRGAKTFRRGRAIAFLDMLNTKRSILQQQLHSPELQAINPVIAGELKAIEMVISEFTQLFEIHEFEIMEAQSQQKDEGTTSL